MSEPEAVVTLNEVFDGFKNHFNGHSISTELTFSELLRKTHPAFHVTCTSPARFDLMGYAAAGHAKIKLDCDESTLDATRTYKVKAKGDQSLQDRISARNGGGNAFVRHRTLDFFFEFRPTQMYILTCCRELLQAPRLPETLLLQENFGTISVSVAGDITGRIMSIYSTRSNTPTRLEECL